MGRAAIGLAGVIGAALVVGGCSALDESGITLSRDGTPAVINCGTWLTGVAVRDAGTGRIVWFAQVDSEADLREGDSGVAGLKLGRLPAGGWSEWVRYEADPRPDRWQFVVYSDGGAHVIIEMADVDLSTDTVVRPGGDAVSAEDFRDECNGELELTPGTVALGTGSAVVVIGLVTVIVRSELKQKAARRRSVASFPPQDS